MDVHIPPQYSVSHLGHTAKAPNVQLHPRMKNFEKVRLQMQQKWQRTLTRFGEFLPKNVGRLSTVQFDSEKLTWSSNVSKRELKSCREAGMATLEVTNLGGGEFNFEGLPPGCAFNFTRIMAEGYYYSVAPSYHLEISWVDRASIERQLRESDGQGILGFGLEVLTTSVTDSTGKITEIAHSQLGEKANFKATLVDDWLVIGFDDKGRRVGVPVAEMNKVLSESIIIVDQEKYEEYLKKLEENEDFRELIKKNAQPAAVTLFIISLLVGYSVYTSKRRAKFEKKEQRRKVVNALIVGVHKVLRESKSFDLKDPRLRGIIEKMARKEAGELYGLSPNGPTEKEIKSGVENIVGEKFIRRL